jgi:proline iminopeptidase
MAQGYVRLPKSRIFFRTFGRGEALVFVHGGPAYHHAYFLPWVRPLERSFRLVLYDQAGSGRSSKRTDMQYDFNTMTADLEGLRRKLRLGRINVLGHSWGGMLALEYACRHPSAVRRLILANTFVSGKDLNRALRRMRNSATEGQRAILRKHERRGLFRDGPSYPNEYGRIANEVYTPFVRAHMKQVPRTLARMTLEFDVYRQIWGESGEFRVTGHMRDWDATPSLPNLPMPTLLIVGRDDMEEPASARRTASKIPQGECAVFERSSHFPFIEQPALFLAVVADFLNGT